jgi:acyl carrier protein
MSAFYEGLAETFEVDVSEIEPGFSLVDHNWDSLAIVSVIALIDECDDVMLNGTALSKCVTVADLEALIAKAKAE